VRGKGKHLIGCKCARCCEETRNAIGSKSSITKRERFKDSEYRKNIRNKQKVTWNKNKSVPWNKGLTKETSSSVAKNSILMKETQKEKYKDKDYRESIFKKFAITKKKNNKPVWNKGLRKDTDERVAKYALNLKGKPKSDGQKEKYRVKRATWITPKENTKPEVRVQYFLDYLNIFHIPHYSISIKTERPYRMEYIEDDGYEYRYETNMFSYKADEFIPFLKGCLILEVDGEYHHYKDYWVRDEESIKKSLTDNGVCIVFNPKVLIKDQEEFDCLKTGDKKWMGTKGHCLHHMFLDVVRYTELTKQKFRVVRLWSNDINKMSITDFEAFLSKF